MHLHIVPRMPNLPAEHRGPRIFDLLGRPDNAAVHPAAMDELALRLRPLL